MRLLLDQGLPRSTADHLRNFGIDADHVANLGMAAATDEAILEAARDLQAAVVSLDADFHRILAVSKATGPSVVRIRVEGLKGDQMANLLVQVLAAAASKLRAGAAVSVNSTRIRIRSLPLKQ